MRALAIAFGLLPVFGALLACQELSQALGLNADAGTPTATATDADIDSGILGASCGPEANTGTQLCTAVSTCPTVVVDNQANPHCGFRIRGAIVDLVCGCGTSLCPMGSFATCAEATQILATQTETSTCVQLSEDRCTEVTTAAPATTAPTSDTPPAAANPACDKSCMQECGGGGACASVCNCS